ncbi:MAG: GGDEF domain-containing protein [Planctomycetia bacterium]|jgi:diguanylate cyclase (GGDEF)-like protein
MNIALGAWLAIRLGVGPPTFADAWDALTYVTPSRSRDEGFLAATDLENHLGELLDDAPEDDDFEVEQVVTEEPEGEKEIELDYEVSDMLDPTDPEYWDLSEKFVETSILKLVIAAIKTGMRMTSVDTALRSEQENPTQDLLNTSQESLIEDCVVYLDEQKAAAEDLEKRLDTLKDQAMALDLASDLEIQTQKLSQTMKRIQEMPTEGDPQKNMVYLLDKLNQLRVIRHILMDVHNQLFLAIARNENCLDAIDTHMLEDHLTKLYNQIGMESTLAYWFAKKRHDTRQLNAALFDLHDFTETNNRLGILLGDKILIELAKLLRAESSADDLLGRYTGQQFLVIYSDVGAQVAIKKAETFRQTIKESTFIVNNEPTMVELNLAFTEISPNDKNEVVVLKRLSHAMEESKNDGPDQSILHDGTYTRRIDSPALRTEPVTIVL